MNLDIINNGLVGLISVVKTILGFFVSKLSPLILLAIAGVLGWFIGGSRKLLSKILNVRLLIGVLIFVILMLVKGG